MAILPDSIARSPGLKFLLVALITIAMSVPLLFIFIALMERQEFARDTASDIARGFGGVQVVGGPALAVPYIVTESSRSAEGVVTTADVRRVAIFLPKLLKGEGRTKTETRARGIYDVNVYRADVTLSGSFAPNFADFNFVPKAIQWDQALLLLSISDQSGLSENAAVTWGAANTIVPFRPGLLSELEMFPGINARVPLAANSGETPFSITIKLSGSREIYFSAAGEATEIALIGNWPHPSFQGNFLPTTRTILSDGFSALWKVPHIARNLPQAMPTPNNLITGLSTATFGVSFFQPVDHYLLVARALKYAILFIGLAFLSFFLIETLSGSRLHGVQYLLIGGAQIVFYLLLLSLSEHVGFDLAYMVAAAATVLLITLYAWSAFKSPGRASIVFAVLTLLYALLFLLLNEEDYALVIGASIAFAAIAVTMYATRNVDWYRSGQKPAVGFGLTR